MIFHTVVCGSCGWTYGPTSKKRTKEMLHLHKEIHRLEDILKEQVEPCIGKDPTCPCADGLACHYKDYPAEDGWPAVKGWPVPE